MGRINKALHKMYDTYHTWDVFKIMEMAGITYLHNISLSSGVRGVFHYDEENNPYIIIDSSIHGEKEISRIAHELGHFFLGHNPNNKLENENRTLNHKNRMEYEADQFATCVELKCFDAVEYEDSHYYEGNYKLFDDELNVYMCEEPIMEDGQIVPNVTAGFVKFSPVDVNSPAEQLRLDQLYKTDNSTNTTLSYKEYKLQKILNSLSEQQLEILSERLNAIIPTKS